MLEGFALEGILSLIPARIYCVDRSGNVIYCNELQASDYGLEPKDIIGKNISDFQSGEIAQQILETNNQIIESGQEIEVEEPALLANGTRIILLSRKLPLRKKDGSIAGVVGISIDLSDRKNAEEMRIKAKIAEARAESEADKSHALFVMGGSMAHDFRTPIATLNNLNYLLKLNISDLVETYGKALEANIATNPNLSSKKLKQIGEIPTLSEQTIIIMNALVSDNLRTVTQAATEEIKADQLVKCSSYRCIRSTIEKYPFKDSQSSKIRYLSEVYFDFFGNEIFIIRILTNLVKNALEQIESHGSGDITIWAEIHEDHNQLHVKDTAGGASPDVVEQMFSGFFTTKSDGHGIGLPFCKKVMEIFGGQLDCISQYGESMEFILKFPKIQSE